MEQSSWEADSRSVSQGIPNLFMGPEAALLCSRGTATDPCPEPDESNSYSPNLFP